MSKVLLSARATRVTAFAPLALIAALLLLSACDDDNDPTAPEAPQFTEVTASGDLTTRVAEFRALLGDPSNGGAIGEQLSGRREINWEGVPANETNTDTFSPFFFNLNAPRGQIFSTPGTGLRVSNNDFADLSGSNGDQFNPFSGVRTFAAVGSNIIDVTFQVAATATTATVTGFGVVFSDVDVANVTTMEFFDIHGESLGLVRAPVRSDAAGLSFAGAVFTEAIVARVRLTLGQAPVAAGVNDVSASGTLDLVIVDDFFAAEPRAGF